MRAIQITEFGGPEVLVLAELPDPVAGPGEVLVEVSRAGVNYADTHNAENSYLAPATLPLIPGNEVVGHTPDGRRVVAIADAGGYAERVAVPEAMAVEVPDGVDDVTALGLVVQGTTAWLLLRHTTRLEPGESVVVHAAAGGVGTLAVQLAKAMGAGRVIASASTPRKRELALELGADVAIDPAADDLTAAIRAANGGKRVDVVLEMTGGRVTDQSIAALAPLGRLGFFGMASRTPPKPVNLAALLSHSTTVSGLWLPHAFTRLGLFERAMGELFAAVVDGSLKVVPGGDYALSDTAAAHTDIRSRGTVGKLVLDPSR
ncbi:NADPH:quinone oxidoreductase family protein [Actinokineospora sp. NBRC 105648]|uniref:quinone oxidoreductase family protein n=1 Tax=Actinokineospora sp. NBRC 105648 TaxID=3032206 RepID=UPI0024A0D4C5|nr:NADPH:quinone oxidoreductase family protein [Actinokineospora sp. NBRC 105648]GLZ43342.1 NADPH:quinone reductase [Actinokineospora sp. NBRC 105648]